MNVKWQLLADQVEAKLKQMKLEGSSLSLALGSIGRVLTTRIRLGFKLGVSPYGMAWQPLSIGSKRYGQQPLRDTGRLQQSITSDVQGDSVVVGTNVIYARTHQYGRPIGKGHIPARPFLPLKGDNVELPEAWAKSALGAMSKAMGLT